ncbi:MAG: radical SAM protein [Archangiaceae bacterium]|nr:radical SAM protein [Archangiaceae bacterium]
MTSAAASRRTLVLHLGGACTLTCQPLCDCAAQASRAPLRELEGGGRRVELRGNAGEAALAEAIAAARASGFEEIFCRVGAAGLGDAAALARLAAAGATGVVAPLFSTATVVHDRLAGKGGALVQLLVTLRAADAAGLSVELEVPLLPARLQSLTEAVALALRAVPKLAAVRFQLSRSRLEAPIAPDAWAVAGPRLAAALRACREANVRAELRGQDAIPFCALAGSPELLDAFRFHPRKQVEISGCEKPSSPCGSCAARAQCPGVAASYAAAHGVEGLAPFSARPAQLYRQSTSRQRVWTPEARRAASRSKLLVLRPTVNCNQDCTFCSANESSKNVWPDPAQMLRSIARAGQRGVERLSFSGGEPTLSKHLPAFVRAAKRVGIAAIEVVTNGVLLDSATRVKPLVDAGLTHAFVSLHAHDEQLSKVLTQKEGDFARTVRAVKALLDAGVVVVLNHVINARNQAFLKHYVEFCHREFEGRALISFAFVTPQYKALEDLAQVPRLSDVQPVMMRALWRAYELQQPVVVGSRQGVPPCFLGEFRAWSDVTLLQHEAAAEDAPQKTHGPACSTCRYRSMCTGLWRPYAARYGVDELSAIEGEPFTEADIEAFRTAPFPTGFRIPTRFEQIPAAFRDREGEVKGRDRAFAAASREPELPASFAAARSRPVRVLLLGTGRQARRLAAAAARVEGFSIEGVASPHAPDAEAGAFGNVGAWRDAREALEAIRPEAVIVASATAAHADGVRAALERGLPVLVEKPLAGSLADAEALARLPGAASKVSCVHNLLFSPGLLGVLGEARARISLVRRAPRTSPDALPAWSRSGVQELLHHLLAVTRRAMGEGGVTVTQAKWAGVSTPESLALELAYPRGAATVSLDFDAGADALELETAGARWVRAGRQVTLTRGSVSTPVEQAGSDLELLLAAFREQVLGRAAVAIGVAEAVEVMRDVAAALEALERAGLPFARPNAPVHVRSTAFRASAT